MKRHCIISHYQVRYSYALIILGSMYGNGGVTNEDIENFFHYFSLAAQGNSTYQFFSGLMHINGEDIENDSEKDTNIT